MIARRCYVSGRVQGVFFRAATRERAQRFGCRGHARNLADGRVEVLIVGEPAAVRTLIDWLWQGPPAAHVQNVEVQELDPQTLDDPPGTFLVS